MAAMAILWTLARKPVRQPSLIVKKVQASHRPVTTDPHDHVEVGFVLIRAFNGPGWLDVLPKKGIVSRGQLDSEKFRRGMRCSGAGKHGRLLPPPHANSGTKNGPAQFKLTD